MTWTGKAWQFLPGLLPEERRLQEDCPPNTFGDIRMKLLTLDLSAVAPCVPEDEKKPVVYKFTVTPKRCALPGIVLGYSLLIAITGIVKSRIAPHRHDFWFKPPKDPEPPKTAKQKAKERLKILKVLCFGAFLSGVLGRLAVPLGALFLLLLALWTIFGPIVIAFIYYLTNPNLLLRKCGCKLS